MSTGADNRPAPRGTRPDRSFGEVVRGVLVLAVGVLVAVWVGSLFRNDTVVEPAPVDYLGVAEQAEPAADFALAVPAELPAGWRATSARFDPLDERWHVGILTDVDEYVGVEQSGGAAADLLRSYAPDAEPAGTVDVGGTDWRRLVDGTSGEVALALQTRQAATVVTGTAPESALALVAREIQSTLI